MSPETDRAERPATVELTTAERHILEDLRPKEGAEPEWRSRQDMEPMNMGGKAEEHLRELGYIERKSRNGEYTTRHWYRWRITEAGLTAIGGKRPLVGITNKLTGKTVWL